jgi:phasin family protein
VFLLKTFSLKAGRFSALQEGRPMMKTAEQFMSFSQANVEAMVKSSQIFASGWQDLTKQMAATAQASMDETMSTFRALTTVKSIKEAMELHTSLAKSTIEKAVAQTGHVTETSFKLAEQAMEPIASRVSVAVESFKAG